MLINAGHGWSRLAAATRSLAGPSEFELLRCCRSLAGGDAHRVECAVRMLDLCR